MKTVNQHQVRKEKGTEVADEKLQERPAREERNRMSCIIFPVYQNNLHLFLYITGGLGFVSVFLMLGDNILESVLTVLNLMSTIKDKA